MRGGRERGGALSPSALAPAPAGPMALLLLRACWPSPAGQSSAVHCDWLAIILACIAQCTASWLAVQCRSGSKNVTARALAGAAGSRAAMEGTPGGPLSQLSLRRLRVHEFWNSGTLES